MIELVHFAAKLSAGILLLLVVLFPVAYLVIGHPYDKLFKNVKTIFDPCVPILSQISRTLCYMFCIVFYRRYQLNEYPRVAYDNYNFYTRSSSLQKAFSAGFISTLLLCVSVFFIDTLISLLT